MSRRDDLTAGRDIGPERLIHTSTAGARQVTVKILSYDSSHLDERTVTRPGETLTPTPPRSPGSTSTAFTTPKWSRLSGMPSGSTH